MHIWCMTNGMEISASQRKARQLYVLLGNLDSHVEGPEGATKTVYHSFDKGGKARHAIILNIRAFEAIYKAQEEWVEKTVKEVTGDPEIKVQKFLGAQTDPKYPEFEKRWAQFLEIEETVKVRTIKYSHLNAEENHISPAIIASLDPLIDFDDEQEAEPKPKG